MDILFPFCKPARNPVFVFWFRAVWSHVLPFFPLIDPEVKLSSDLDDLAKDGRMEPGRFVKRSCSALGVQHLQQQFVDGDAALAVQPPEGVHGAGGALPQQREAHQQPARPVRLPAGTLVVLQRLLQAVLEPLQRVRRVRRLGV